MSVPQTVIAWLSKCSISVESEDSLADWCRCYFWPGGCGYGFLSPSEVRGEWAHATQQRASGSLRVQRQSEMEPGTYGSIRLSIVSLSLR